ncbi:hypothetical protein TRVL_08477 [Trypanosoma vivax]|uniref:Uncharacterized protein n=1 Tax=Trypanosoma vivax (strain Y486) TaxID=1055687 RepID=G0U250_TRYVY|nr:hypothetical protein TRVL_08477 [Trypanosoma vivax]CCC50353.1 conserved hypothetical protein [Trypanosoma vivax Y486]
MHVRYTDVSAAAIKEEGERRKDFFTLLYVVRRLMYAPTPVEWCLIEQCLDDINYKYPDFLFLYGFVCGLAFRNRRGRTLLSRYSFPLYTGLVGYDCGLRATSPCPSVAFWNSVTLFDSPLGEAARLIYAPNHFCDVNEDAKLPPVASSDASFLQWLWTTGHSIMWSLSLQSVARHVFDESKWKYRTDGGSVTSLVMNSRLFKWKIMELITVNADDRTIFQLNIGFPHFTLPLGIRRSYHNRHMIFSSSSIGGQVWYRLHFLPMYWSGFSKEQGVR